MRAVVRDLETMGLRLVEAAEGVGQPMMAGVEEEVEGLRMMVGEAEAQVVRLMLAQMEPGGLRKVVMAAVGVLILNLIVAEVWQVKNRLLERGQEVEEAKRHRVRVEVVEEGEEQQHGQGPSGAVVSAVQHCYH